MIADIMLGECNGRGWLVRGEQYIDDFLANTLPAHVTVAVVTCESKTEIDELRLMYAGPADTEEVMWLVHPAIVNRARGQMGQFTIAFAEWSASLNPSATDLVQSAFAAASKHAAYVLALVRHLPPDAPAMVVAMADLRCGLLEAQLAGLGMPPERIIRETHIPTLPGQADRIDLMVRPR